MIRRANPRCLARPPAPPVLFRRPAEPIQFGDPGLHPDHYAKPGAVGDQIASRRGLANTASISNNSISGSLASNCSMVAAIQAGSPVHQP